MANTTNQEFWLEFIEMLKSFPRLWKVKIDVYKDRSKKSNCYQQLLGKMQEIIPDATRYMVSKKINSFCIGYRRELDKVIKSEISCTGSLLMTCMCP